MAEPTKEDIANARAAFHPADSNGDGRVTPEEEAMYLEFNNVRPRKMPRRDIHGCCPFPRPRDGLLSLPRGKIRCHDWPNHQRVLRAVRRWVLLPRRRNRQAWREVPRWCVEETVLGELREIRDIRETG